MSVMRRRMFPGHYIQDGLDLHLDGIENTLHGHDSASPYWYDLSGHVGPVDVTVSADYSWDGNSLIRAANSVPPVIDTGSPLAPEGIYTVEAVFSLPELPNGATINYTVYRYLPALQIRTDDAGSTFAYFLQGPNKNYSIQIPFQAPVGSKIYSSAVCWQDPNNQDYTVRAFMMVIGGEKYSGTFSLFKNVTTDNMNICSWNQWGGSILSAAHFYAFRKYGRPLTEAELAHNYMLDKRRYSL